MYKACVIVLSNREYTGEEEDCEGREVERYLKNNDFEVLVYKIIPEVEEIYKKFIIKCCDNYCVDLVVTIGNNNLSDEVVKEVSEEEKDKVKEYKRKKTILKNMKEDISKVDVELQNVVESIKNITG